MVATSPSTVQPELLLKLRQRQALIGVVGLGYVGLPLCLTYAEKGYRVLGLDIDQAKTEAIEDGRSYIQHIEAGRIQQARAAGRLEASTDFSRAAEADALILCVPTAVHYPTLLCQQPALAGCGQRCQGGCATPQAQRASERVLSLPMHPYLSETDQDTVVAALAAALH